jgi:hypothetical protein
MCKQNGQNQRQRKYKQRIEIDGQGISQNGPEAIIIEKFLEILETYPGTGFNGTGDAVIAEGNLCPIHGNVFKKDQNCHRNNKHDI